MSGKRRLAIFLSVLWVLLSILIGIAADKPFGVPFIVGFVPLVIVWGSWWVVQGFRSSRKDRPPSVTTPVPDVWKSEADPKDDLPTLPNDAPYLRRLWLGQIGLASTFWIWGFAGLGLLRAVDLLASQHLVWVQQHIVWYYAFMACSLAYAIFVWVAIWRSARRSKAKVGPGLAQLWVFLGAIQTIVMYVGVYEQQTKTAFSDVDLAVSASQINQGLPEKIDDITILESVSASGRRLIFRYRVTLDDYIPDVQQAKARLVANACQEGTLGPMLKNGILVAYDYHSTRGELGTVFISNDDCRVTTRDGP